MKKISLILFSVVGILLNASCSTHGSRLLTSHGYDKCIELSNAECRVVLEPMGPWEWIVPGESSSFTETWTLFNVKGTYALNQYVESID